MLAQYKGGKKEYSFIKYTQIPSLLYFNKISYLYDDMKFKDYNQKWFPNELFS